MSASQTPANNASGSSGSAPVDVKKVVLKIDLDIKDYIEKDIIVLYLPQVPVHPGALRDTLVSVFGSQMDALAINQNEPTTFTVKTDTLIPPVIKVLGLTIPVRREGDPSLNYATLDVTMPVQLRSDILEPIVKAMGIPAFIRPAGGTHRNGRAVIGVFHEAPLPTTIEIGGSVTVELAPHHGKHAVEGWPAEKKKDSESGKPSISKSDKPSNPSHFGTNPPKPVQNPKNGPKTVSTATGNPAKESSSKTPKPQTANSRPRNVEDSQPAKLQKTDDEPKNVDDGGGDTEMST
jgi:hypothetical protein